MTNEKRLAKDIKEIIENKTWTPDDLATKLIKKGWDKVKKYKSIEKKLGVDIETFYHAMLYGRDECEIEKDGNNYLVIYYPYIDWCEGRLSTDKTIYRQDGTKQQEFKHLGTIEVANWVEILHGTGKYKSLNREQAIKDIEFALVMRGETQDIVKD